MKKYMLIITDDEGDETTTYTDDLDEAMSTRMNAECRMEYQTELYSAEKDAYGVAYYQRML